MLLLVSLLPAEGLHLEKTTALSADVVSGITKIRKTRRAAGAARDNQNQNLTSA
jgi:hypothetical protein